MMEPDSLNVSGGEDEWSRSCTPESIISAGIPPEELYTSEDEEEDLDAEMGHTIASDLEKLTDTGSSVNKLEIALLEARKEYENCKRDSQVKLIQLRTRLKSSIEKTEPFVVAWRKAREYQQQAHEAAMAYERANSEFESAKETLRIAERGIAELKEEQTQSQNNTTNHEEEREGKEEDIKREDGDKNENGNKEEEDMGSVRKSSAVAIDEAWQETLANATLKVENANQKKIESEIEHRRITVEYQKIQADCRNMETKLKRSIKKSKPYYEERFSCNQRLVGIKKKIQLLQQNIDDHKVVYKRTMKHLESLSGLMHEERVRRRTNSSLDITSSEPNLLSTKRTLTPDPGPALCEASTRLAATPDAYRKKEWASANVRVMPPFTGKSIGAAPVISTNTITASSSSTTNTSNNVRDTVTDCLTRALGSSPPPTPPLSSCTDDKNDKLNNCTVTVSVSHNSFPLPASPQYGVAKQLVENVLDNALLQLVEQGCDYDDPSNGNHGNITLSNGSHDDKDTPTDH